jgi:uncharacterized membrane protein HdeD (DUF308 family)
VSIVSVPTRPGYWPIAIARAVVALALAAAITFNADHSPQFGLIVFGIFAVLTGVVVAVGSARSTTSAAGRGLVIIQGVIGIVAGVVAIAANGGGLGFLLYLVSVYAAITGGLEIYGALRKSDASPATRDLLIVGIATAILALVFLLIPPDAVFAVGFLGAYGAVLGVFLVIAGLSLKWSSAKDASARTAAATEDGSVSL